MLSSAIARVSYTGNDATSVYSYGCRLFASSDLLVVVRLIASPYTETTLVLTTDYTVGTVGSSTGNITLINASQLWLNGGNLSSAYKIVIRRVRPLTQNTSIRNQGAYLAAIHEDVFDNLVMICQQLLDIGNRSVRLPDTYSSSDFNPHLPAGIIGVPNLSLVTDSSTGTTLVPGPSVATISGAVASAAAAAASAISSASSAGNAAASATAAATSASAAAASATAAATSASSIASAVSGASNSANAITASGGLGSAGNNSQFKNYVIGSGGPVTVTKNPAIPVGLADGQRYRIVGTDDTDTVTLSDGNGLALNGPWTGNNHAILDLDWDAAANVWTEVSRSNP